MPAFCAKGYRNHKASEIINSNFDRSMHPRVPDDRSDARRRFLSVIRPVFPDRFLTHRHPCERRRLQDDRAADTLKCGQHMFSIQGISQVIRVSSQITTRPIWPRGFFRASDVAATFNEHHPASSCPIVRHHSPA